MHPRQPRNLHTSLQIIRARIPRIHTPILIRLITDLQQLKHLPLIHAHRAPQLRETLIRIIPRLIHHVRVKVVRLRIEQLFAKVPELVRGKLEDGDAGFVDERGGGVPGLDLLAEDELDVVGVGFVLRVGDDGGVDCFEHFGAEGADVVEVWGWLVLRWGNA